MKTETEIKDLEIILTFLDFSIIDYKGKRCTNGHKTAKTIGEIKKLFGKEIMCSGQFLEDFTSFDFQNDWNDLKFLLEQIQIKCEDSEDIDFLKDYLWSFTTQSFYEECLGYIKEEVKPILHQKFRIVYSSEIYIDGDNFKDAKEKFGQMSVEQLVEESDFVEFLTIEDENNNEEN